MCELHILFRTTNCLLERRQFAEMRAFSPIYSLISLCFRICICFYSAFSRVSSLPRHSCMHALSHEAVALSCALAHSLSLRQNAQPAIYLLSASLQRCCFALPWASLPFSSLHSVQLKSAKKRERLVNAQHKINLK